MPSYDRLRREAVRSITIGRTPAGVIHYGAGAALMVPAKAALARLVRLHRRAVGESTSSAHIDSLSSWAAQILHRRETLGVLGTLLGVGKEARGSLERSIMSFAESRSSLEGIESVVLSASFGVAHEDPREGEKWRRLLGEIGAPRVLGGGYDASPVVDPLTREFTHFGSDTLTQYLAGETGDAQRVPRPDPGVIVSDDPSRCVKVMTVVSSLVGLAGGAALGGVAGGSVDNGHSTAAIIVGINGGAIAGFFGGAQGGQSFGQAVCPNATSGTPAPSSSGGTPAPTDLPQGQWEQNLIDSTPDSSPDPADQNAYNNGFDAGWAAATSGGSGASGGSDSFGAGFADGYGAAQAMQTLPGGNAGGTVGGSNGGGDGNGDGGSANGGAGGSGGEGTSGEGGGGEGVGASGASADDPDEGGVGDGPVSPGTGVIFHHFNPSGPGTDGLESDDGDDTNLDSPVRSSGSPVVRLVNPPDPDNNPRAVRELGTATLAQAALLSATIAERLSGIATV